MDNCNIGRHSKIRRAIIDKNKQSADQRVKDSAGRTIQYATVAGAFVDDPLPLGDRGLHDRDLVHRFSLGRLRLPAGRVQAAFSVFQ